VGAAVDRPGRGALSVRLGYSVLIRLSIDQYRDNGWRCSMLSLAKKVREVEKTNGVGCTTVPGSGQRRREPMYQRDAYVP